MSRMIFYNSMWELVNYTVFNLNQLKITVVPGVQSFIIVLINADYFFGSLCVNLTSSGKKL